MVIARLVLLVLAMTALGSPAALAVSLPEAEAVGIVVMATRVRNGVLPPHVLEAEGKPRENPYLVDVAIDADGKVVDSAIVSDVPAPLQPSVLQAASKVVFVPARRDGVAVPSRTHLTVTMSFMPRGQDYEVSPTGISASGPWPRIRPLFPVDAARNDRSARVWAEMAFRADGSVDEAASSITAIEFHKRSGNANPGDRFARVFSKAVMVVLPRWSHPPEEVDGDRVAMHYRIPFTFCGPGAVTCWEAFAERPEEARTAADPSIVLARIESTGL